jgi:hypothetical protein
MFRKIYGTNFLHIIWGRSSIKCQNGPVLPPALVLNFNVQPLHTNLQLKQLPKYKWNIQRYLYENNHKHSHWRQYNCILFKGGYNL